MIKIHRIIFIAIIVLLISCVKKNNSNNITLKKVEKKVIKSNPIKEEKPFILNDKNAIPFFFEYSKKNKENKVRIQTKYGEIDILLFDETPYHRSNFIYLTKKKYFDGTYFHRIVKDFIIQGGNSDSYEISKRRKNIGRYLLPPDIKKGLRHDRGVVSMPSSDIENPYKLASPYEFFIVQSKNGAYHLDTDYTPFGKVIRGISVVDKINSLETDKREWPFENVKIKVSIID